MNIVCLNGHMIEASEASIHFTNRSYRYGDGLFETMRIEDGKILLKQFHFERLFAGLVLLKYEIPSLFTESIIEEQVIDLYIKNKSTPHAKIRLSVSRGNGNLNELPGPLQYIIECDAIQPRSFKARGLRVNVYPFAKKSYDIFSGLKSSSFLLYVMAAQYAKENKLDDCLILNSSGNIADSTIANVFIVKNNVVYTPLLSEACVNGVMRKHIIETLILTGHEVKEKSIDPAELEQADEIFLTNAVRGIQWVEFFGNKKMNNSYSSGLYQDFFKTI